MKVEDESCKIQLWHFTRTVNDPKFLKTFYDGAYSLIYAVDTSEIDALKKIKSHYEEYLTLVPNLRINPHSDQDHPYVLLSISPDPNSLANRKAGDYAQRKQFLK